MKTTPPSLRRICVVVLMLATYANTIVLAAPVGGHAVSGSASFQQNGNLTVITAGNRSVINYSSFNVGAAETVRFVQPSATSTVLNRVTDPNPTNIFGQIQSNGIITIANPYGVFFQNGSVLNVGGLYAAAGNISTADFTAGRIHFTDLQGDVRNDGILAAQNQIALMGANVVNNGTMTATKGLAMMVSGRDVYVGARNGNIFVQANGGASSAAAGSITNRGTVAAPRVLLGAGDMYSTAIVNTGLLQGRTLTVNAGRHGNATVGGRLDASSTTGKGGDIQVQGGTVALLGATLDASGSRGGGTVRVGGDFHGGGTLSRSTTTTADAATRIKADATGTTGGGGSVVLWSDAATSFAGQISARGGTRGGNGGSVEVSSANRLFFTGLADLTAPAGAVGSLLLDPKNITIDDTNPTDPVVPAPTTGTVGFADLGPSQINAAALGSELGKANVILQATTDITIGANVTGATVTAGNGNLTLQAGRSILFSGAYTLTLQGMLTATFNYADASAATNVVITAGRDAGPAAFSMPAGSKIVAPGGVTISGGTLANDDAATGSLDANTGLVTLQDITTSSATAGTASGAIAISNNATPGKNIVVNGTLATTPLVAATSGGNVTLTPSGTLGVNGISADRTGSGVGGTVALNGTAAAGVTAITAGGAITGDSLTVNPGTGLLRLNGATVTTSGASGQAYQGPVVLGATGTTTLTAGGGGPVNFTGSVTAANPSQALTVDTTTAAPGTPGSIVFGGAVGSATPLLASLTTKGGAVDLNGGSVTTSGVQSYGGAVTLGNNTVLTGSSVAFNSTFTGNDGASDHDLTLTLGGTAVVSGNLAGIRNFVSNGPGTTQVSGIFITSGSQTYGNALTLTADATLTSGGAGDIALNATVKGAFNLTLNPAGTAMFGGVVGGAVNSTDNLTSLVVNGNASTLAGGTAVTTSGAQRYTGSLTLGSTGTLTSTAGTVTVGSLDGSASDFGLTVNAVSSSFGTIANAGDLNFAVGAAGTGAVFTGTVDAFSLTVTGGPTALNGGTVTTSGATGQSYGAVSLGTSTTLTANASAPVTFGGTVDGLAPGAQALTVLTDGTTTFGGLVGSGNALGSLTVGSTTVTGGTTIFNSGGVAVTTLRNGTATGTGLQTYYNAVNLGLDTTFISNFTNPGTVGGDITFNGTVDSATATPSAIAVDTSGNEIFNALVGGVRPLRSLATDTTGPVGGSVQFNMSLVGKPVNTAGVTLGTDGLLTRDVAIFNVLGSSSAKVPSSVSGTTGTNNPSITSTGTQPQSYQGGVTDQQDTVIQGPAIVVAGTFDAGNKALTFDLGNQAVMLPNLPGATFANLASLASVGDGGTTLTGDIPTTGYQSYGNLSTNGGVTLANDVTLTSSGGAVIGFGGTVNGAHRLTVNTSGDELFNGPVGNMTPLTSLQTDAGGTVGGTVRFNLDATGLAAGQAGVTAATVTIGDGVAFNVTGTVPGPAATAVSSVRTTNGQTYSGAASLGQDAVLTDTGTGISFVATVDGTRNLTLNATGSEVFEGRVGGGNPLLSLTTNGGTVRFELAGTVGLPNVTTVNNAAPGGTATGGQTYNSSVELYDDTVLSSTFTGPATGGGAITFKGTVDSFLAPVNLTVLAGPGQTVFGPGATVNAAGLNVGGAQVTFDAPVGASGALNVLTVGRNGTLAGVTPSIDLNGGLITTTQGQTFTDAVFLSVDTTLNDTNAQNIAFSSTVDSLDATPRALTLSTTGGGTITFNGIVGGVHALSALTATTATGGTTFNMTLAGSAPGVTTGTGGVTVTGPVTFNVAGSTLARPSILTTGPQIYQGATPAIEGADTVLRGTTLAIAGGINGNGHDLTLDFSAGPVVVDGHFTGIRNFTSVGAGGTDIGATGGVTFTTTGFQDYGNAVTLLSNVTLASGNNDITFEQSLGGPFALVLQPGTGTAFFQGPVGGTPATRLASLAVFGNTSLGGGAVTTVGEQDYLGSLTLTNTTVLTTSGEVTVDSLAGGGFDLTVNANGTNFGLIANGGNLLFNVGGGVGAVFAGTVNALSLRVAGGKADLGADVTTNSATLGQGYAQLQLNGSVTLRDDAGGPISSGRIDGSGAGGQTLALSTGGQITFNGAVGSILALGSLTTGGGGQTVFNVNGGVTVTTIANGTTTGGQTYNEAVVLDQGTTLFSFASGAATNAGAVLFGGTVDSATSTTPASLTVLAGNGQTVFGPGATVNANALNIGGALVTFAAPVGGNGKLDVLTVGRSGVYTVGTSGIDLNGGLVNSTLGQTYNDPVTLSADTTLKDNNNGDIAFNATINGDGVAPRSLTLTTGGAVVLGGVIGNLVPLDALTVTTGGGTTFQMDFLGQPAGTAGVNVGAGGVTVNGSATFAVTGGSLLDLTHVTVRSTGAQTYDGAVTLEQDTSFQSTSSLGRDIVFNGPVDGSVGLAANAFGNVVFGGIVGGGAPLTSLTTDTLVASNGQTRFNVDVTGRASGIAGVRVGAGGITVNDQVLFGVTGSTPANPSVETYDGGTQTYRGAATLAANTVLVGDASGATPPAGGGYLGGGAIVFGSSVAGAGGAPSLSIYTGTGPTTFSASVDVTSLNVTGAQVTFGGTVGGLGALFILPNGAAGGPIDLNGGTSAGYTVRTTGGQVYGSALVLGADTILTNGTANADLVLGSTVDGAHTLTLDTAGRIIFDNLVGSTAALTGLTTNTPGTPGLDTEFNLSVGGAAAGVVVNGPVVINDPVSINVGGGSLTHPSILTVGNNPQTYNGAVSLATNTVLVSASTLGAGGVYTGGGAIRLSSTAGITGAAGSSLSIRAGAGTTTLGGAINVVSLDLGGGQVAISGPVTLPRGNPLPGGNLSIEPNDASPLNAVQFNGGGLTTAGGQIYHVAVLLGADTVLTSLNATGDGGNIVFASTVDGKFALTLNTSGDEIFNGIVGGSLPLTSLTTDATGVVSGSARFNMDVTGAPAGVAGVNVSGAVTINDAVSFNVAGTGLAVGGPASVATGGAQRYVGAATLLQDAALTSANSAGDGGNILFASTVDGAHGLFVSGGGVKTFDGVVGGTNALTSLTTNLGTTTFNIDLGAAPGAPAAVRIAGPLTIGAATIFNVTGSTSARPAVLTLGDFAQTYDGAVTLPRSAVLAGAGVLTFGSTVDGPGALTLNTINQTIFNGAVGAASPLLAFTGGSGPTVIDGGTFTTQNAQTYGGPVFIGKDTTLTSLDTTGGNGRIFFGSTLDGAFALTVSAADLVTLGGASGIISPLLSLRIVQGPAGTTLVNGGTITTEGRQTYGGTVVLGNTTVLRSLATAPGSDGTITFQTKLEGGFGLTVSTPGNVFFDGAVGDAQPLLSLTTTAGAGTTTLAGGLVTTTGAQVYGGPVQLGAGTVLNSRDSQGGGVTFGGTVNGAFALTIDTGAKITFGGSVGAGAGGALTSLTTQGSGQTIFQGSQVTTTGAQDYGNPVLLAANNAFAGGGVAFRNTVDGGYILQVKTPGQAFFGGLVGGATPLAQVTTKAGSTTVFDHAGITTTGLQTYGGAVLLNSDAVLTSTQDKDVTFAGTVDGRHGLTINTNGNTTFDAAVGNATLLSSLTVTDGGGTTIFNGPGVRTTGAQTYGNAATLPAGTVAFTSVDGAITFGKTLDGTRPGGTDLTLGTTGVTTLDGNVGATGSLASLTVAGPLAIGGERIVTSGGQRYMNTVAANPLTTHDTQLTATAGNIRFDGAVTAKGSLAVTAERVGAQGDITTVGDLDLQSMNAASPLLLLLGNNYVSSGGAVRFNTLQAYHPGNPRNDAATVILGSGGSVSIRGKSFTMGFNQKVFAAGSLDINVGGGVATVGDLAAKNTLGIQAGEVILLDREMAASPSAGGLNNGLNFVAENGISFGGANIVFAGTGNRTASFVTTNGNVDIQRVQGLSLFKDTSLATQFAVTLPNLDELGDFSLLVFEPVSGGTQSLDTAAALSGALPDQKPVDVAADITISASQMEELKKLGIHPRLAQRSERGSGASKRALFAQLVDGEDQENYGRLQPIKGGVSRLEPSDFVVVVDRMGEREVQSILSSFEGLYGKNKEKTPEIGGAFQTAFNDYTVAKQTADPAGFADFLQGKPGKYPAVDSAVRGFDDLFGHIEHLGLTNKEVAKSEEHITSDLGVSGVSPEDMVKTINALRKKLPPEKKAASTKAPASAPVANPAPASALPNPTPAAPKPAPAAVPPIPEIMPTLPPVTEPPAAPAPTPAPTPAPPSAQNTTRQPDRTRKSARQEKPSRPAHRASATAPRARRAPRSFR